MSAEKIPPSYGVPEGPLSIVKSVRGKAGKTCKTYSMIASQTKKLSSLIGPAVIPSGAFRESSKSLAIPPSG